MLVSTNEEFITLILYYRVKSNKHGVRQYKILEEEEAKSFLSKGDKDVDILTTKWVVPTWKSNSNVLRSSTFYNPTDGSNKIDWTKYQENLFKACLKEWDVVDENNQAIPVSAETIGLLPPVIASALLDKYDKSLSLEEEERKKS
jgi:hypothetical protein